jgi:hypothetical protein
VLSYRSHYDDSIQVGSQLLSSLVATSLVDDVELSDAGSEPSVHRQSRVRFRRPATGVSGAESLSSSEDDESRFSPVRGDLARGELSTEDMVELRESWRGDMLVSDAVEVGLRLREWCDAEASESVVVVDAVDAIEDSVELDDCRSECASVYLVVLISSSSGVRKDTRFSAGNMGRLEAILRGINDRAGLLESIETRLWGCLYGIEMLADSLEADVSVDESVDAELGVEALFGAEKLLSIESCGLDGRFRVGAVDGRS